MNSINEKEKKLNIALEELKNLDLTNPELQKNIENLSTKQNQLEIEKTQIEEKYKTLLEEHENLFWCTCPKANLYIEGRLPNYENFKGVKMTIGTDSLASNHTLSIWDEVQTILKNTDLDLNTLLTWACKNGAEFLQLKDLGTFENGKKPGVNLVNEKGVKKLD